MTYRRLLPLPPLLLLGLPEPYLMGAMGVTAAPQNW